MARITDLASLRAFILSKTDEEDGTEYAENCSGVFVQLAEQRMYYGNGDDKVPKLRFREMEVSENLAFVDGEATLPEGFLEKRDLYWPTSPVPVLFEPPRTFWPLTKTDNSGPYPLGYTIERSKIYLRPAVTGNARLLYYKKFDALIDTTDTNWLLTNAPALYIEAVLIEAYRHLEDAEEENKAAVRYQLALAGLNGTEAQSRTAGGSLRRRTNFV